MTIYVLDVETTGKEIEGNGVCELATVPIGEKGTLPKKGGSSWLVNPEQPIPPDARGIHHISDDDVKDAPTLGALFGNGSAVIGALRKTKVIAAHNIEYDYGFLKNYLDPDVQKICTWRCAMHLYPEAPDFKNQTLRYYLNAEPDPRVLKNLAPHRALYDTHVTACILAKMLEQKTCDELIELTGQPALLKKVTFGQHYGKLWSELPVSYLNWIVSKDFDENTIHTARYYIAKSRGYN